jgi:hypothetical protein
MDLKLLITKILVSLFKITEFLDCSSVKPISKKNKILILNSKQIAELWLSILKVCFVVYYLFINLLLCILTVFYVFCRFI